MAKNKSRKIGFPQLTLDRIRRINALIPHRPFQTTSFKSDQLAQAVIMRFFGWDWLNRHVISARTGFLKANGQTELERATGQMRRIMLAEMLYNLQQLKGFRSCLVDMLGGQVESTYAALDIARMLVTLALDKSMTVRIVTPCKTKRRSYDLSVKCRDGFAFRGETKCKLEENEISLSSIEESLSRAKKQLPLRAPGIIFVKVPRTWMDDPSFKPQMEGLAKRFLLRSKSIVSVKYYSATIRIHSRGDNDFISEVVAFNEIVSNTHMFKSLRHSVKNMFPIQQLPEYLPGADYTAMPDTWQRLIVGVTI